MTACPGQDNGNSAADGTILTPYLAIGNVLATDSIEQLPQLGAQVIQAAQSQPNQPGTETIVQGAGRIGARDIQTARNAYKKMSEGVIEYLRSAPQKQDGHSLVHCTMTFGGKGGLWVQREGKIMNPYEGAMMLHCGDKLDWNAELPEV